MHIDHLAIKYLMAKKDSRLRMIRRVLLLQEFHLEIKDKKGTKNLVADHFSRLEASIKEVQINNDFPN